MSPDILIVRDADGYRVLHGHLRLASQLGMHKQIVIDVQGEGQVCVIKTRGGFLISKDGQRTPLLKN